MQGSQRALNTGVASFQGSQSALNTGVASFQGSTLLEGSTTTHVFSECLKNMGGLIWGVRLKCPPLFFRI